MSIKDQLVELFNVECQPQTPFTDISDCLSYTRALHWFYINPDRISVLGLSQVQHPQYERHECQDIAEESQISYLLTGSAEVNLQFIQSTLQMLKQQLQAVDILQALKLGNQHAQWLQDLVFALTGSSDVSARNVRRAADLARTVRDRAGDSACQHDYVQLLIDSKHMFRSDFRQFVHIIEQTFEPYDEVLSLNSAELIRDRFMRYLRRFEERYQVAFSLALRRCFGGELPAYEDCVPTEFLTAAEDTCYRRLVEAAFGVRCARPLYFFTVYYKDLLGRLNEMAGTRDRSMSDCVVRVLSKQQNAALQHIYRRLTGRSSSLSSIGQFTGYVADVFDKFNKQHNCGIIDLVQFHNYQHGGQKASMEEPIDLQVTYNGQIFGSCSENAMVTRQLLSTLKYDVVFRITETKCDGECFQPLYILDSIIEHIRRSFNIVNEEEGVINALNDYAVQIVDLVCSKFYQAGPGAREQKFSDLQSRIDRFTQEYLFIPESPPLRHATKLYELASGAAILDDIPKASPSDSVQSPLLQLLNQCFLTNLSLARMYDCILARLSQNEPILSLFGRILTDNSRETVQKLIFTLFADTTVVKGPQELEKAINNNKQLIQPSFSTTLNIFGYSELLNHRNSLCIDNGYVKSLQKLAQILGYKLNKNAAAAVVLNCVSLFPQLKQDFMALLADNDYSLSAARLMGFLDGMAKNDAILRSGAQLPYFQELALLLLGEGGIPPRQGKLSMLEATATAFLERVQRRDAGLRAALADLDPADATGYAEFCDSYERAVLSRRVTTAQEGVFGRFAGRLRALYVRYKKVYGEAIRSVADVHGLVARESAPACADGGHPWRETQQDAQAELPRYAQTDGGGYQWGWQEGGPQYQ